MPPLALALTRTACVLALGFSTIAVRATALRIDADFPGGNIIVDGIEGDTAFLRPNLRDTQGDWFCWAFRVRGAGRPHASLHLRQRPVLGARSGRQRRRREVVAVSGP